VVEETLPYSRSASHSHLGAGSPTHEVNAVTDNLFAVAILNGVIDMTGREG
jgi:hypothetical protein